MGIAGDDSGSGVVAQTPRRGGHARSWIGVWTGSWRGPVMLVALCLCVILPGFFNLPAIDRDEPRFAQASRQMFETGDFIVPMVQDRPRLNKPPLIYWLQATSARFFTGNRPMEDAIWMYRVPSALCAIGAVLCTYGIGRRIFDARAAWLGAALLAVCPLVVVDAHLARADQLLLVCTTATMGCLWRVTATRGTRVGWVLLLWLCCGLGILAKGPITPLVVLLTIAAFCAWKRDWSLVRWTRVWWGVPIAIACVVPWVVLVVRKVGAETYFRTIYNETIGRSLEASENHKGPPGYHLVLLVVMFFPGSLLTGSAFARVLARGTRAGNRSRWVGTDAELFLLCWTIPTWIFFECVMTKLPHYTLPTFPAIALLTARWTLVAGAHWRGRVPKSVRIGAWIWAGVGAVGVAGFAGFMSWWGPGDMQIRVLGVVLSVGAFIAMIAAGWHARRGIFQRAVTIAGVAWMGLVVLLLGVVLPLAKKVWLTERVVEMTLQDFNNGKKNNITIACVEYQEDSLIFATRGKCVRLSEDQLDAWIEANPRGFVILQVPSKHTLWTSRERRRQYSCYVINGFQLAKGKLAQVAVMQRLEVEEKIFYRHPGDTRRRD